MISLLRRPTAARFLLAACAAFIAAACGPDEPGSEPADEEELGVPSTVTWHEHIAPLVVSRCQGCHTEGGIAPFSLDTYDEAKPLHAALAQSVADGSMPPWGARETDECTPPVPFKDDLRLSDREKKLFENWSAQGAPEGDPALAAPLPALPELALNDANLELTIPSPVTVEGTTDRFKCFRLDPGLSQDVWVSGTQILAGNSAIVHHALVYLDPSDDSAALVDGSESYDCFGGPNLSNTNLLAAWAPGNVATTTPQGVGMELAAGTKLVLQVHYHPTGMGPQTDAATTVQLRYGTEQPEYVSRIYLIGNFGAEDSLFAGGDGFGLTSGPEFLIPAGANDHVETNRFRVGGPNADASGPAAQIPFAVWGVGTHMHYVGRDMKITVEHDGQEQCLVQTPDWDFNWQRAYYYDASIEQMPTISVGDVLNFRCTYDNSLGNPFVREALDEQGLEEPVDVRLGEESLDEMCLGIFGAALPARFAEFLP